MGFKSEYNFLLQGIHFIHDLCRGHQDLHLDKLGILETQEVNREINYIYQYS